MSKNFYSNEEIEVINKSYMPDENREIFRYMDFSKYLNLLEGEDEGCNPKLSFCNARNFEDKFEGEMPEAFYHRWVEDSKNSHKKLYDEINKHFSSYISCWNRGEDESYALWKIYTNPGTGICIRSTAGRLQRALNNNDIKFYNVKYIPSFDDSSFDIELPLYMREHNLTGAPFPIRNVKEVCKLNPYKYEEELRAVYIENSDEPIKYFPVNLEILIDSIYFSPFSPKWFRDLVKKLTLRNVNLKNVNFIDSKIIIQNTF